MAAQDSYLEVLSYLLGESEEVPDAIAVGSLDVLCYLGKLEEVRGAIAAGASVNSRGDRNVTGLMAAADISHVEIVSLLLKHPEIEVNAKDDFNQTKQFGLKV